jgi:hypothetical protein
MVCGQCGAGLTQAMVADGACGYCETAIEGVAERVAVERVVDERVEGAAAELKRELADDLKRDLQRDLARQQRRSEPSVAVVAAREAGRYTAMRVWGCGAGCLSTMGSLAMTLVILGIVAFSSVAPMIDWSKLPIVGDGDKHHESPRKGRRHR